MRRFALYALLVAMPFGVAAQQPPSSASSTPEAGSILRDIQRALPGAPAPQLPARPLTEPAPRSKGDEVFQVKRFQLSGVNLVAPVDVQAVLRPWLNRDVVFADLERALQAIAEFYQERGWYVRPSLPEQDVVDGVVRIDIIEAKLGAIRFDQSLAEALWPISRDRLERTFTSRLSPGDPLSLSQMNRSVSILNETPGVGVKAALDASEQPGATDMLITVERKAPFSGSVSLDNQGARSTGYARVSVNANYDNPRNVGDQIQTNLMASEGLRYARLGYGVPIGYDGMRLAFNGSALHYRLVKGFDSPGGTFGDARTRGAVLTHPWWRAAHGNVNFSLTLNDADYENYFDGKETSRKAGRTAAFGVSGDLYDQAFGGGTNIWGLSLTHGKVVKPLTKLTGNLARLQRLGEKTSVWMSFNGQFAANNLDSSEKFSIAGAQGVRAYPGTQGSGDHGWLLSIEGRFNLTPVMQYTLFHDQARVILNRDPSGLKPENPQGLNSFQLRGVGMGLSYSITPKTSAKLSWSRRLGDNPVPSSVGADADGTRLLNRFWLNMTSYL